MRLARISPHTRFGPPILRPQERGPYQGKDRFQGSPRTHPLLMTLAPPRGPVLVLSQTTQDGFPTAGNDRFEGQNKTHPLLKFQIGNKGPPITISQKSQMTFPAEGNDRFEGIPRTHPLLMLGGPAGLRKRVVIRTTQQMPALSGGAGALDKTQTLADTVNVFEDTSIINTVSIVGGGLGYTLNDILTVVGGIGVAGTLKVTELGAAGGRINAVIVNTVGLYGTKPVNNVSVTGGTGTGATFTLTYTDTSAFVLSRGLDRADTLTLAEAIVLGGGLVKADTLTLTDAIVRDAGLVKSDTITLIDAIVKATGLAKSDAYTLADAVVKAAVLSKSDAFTLTDAQIKGIALAFADSYSLTEDQTRDLISGLQEWVNRMMRGLG